MASRVLDRLLPVLVVLAAAADRDLLGGAHGHAGPAAAWGCCARPPDRDGTIRPVTDKPAVPVAHAVSVLTLLVGGALVTALVSGTAETYEQVQSSSGIASFDQPVLGWMVGHRSTISDTLITLFTNLGSRTWMPVIATVAVLALARLWRTWRPVLLMAAATLGSTVMTSAAKVLTARARPPQQLAVPPYESTPSFPSGRALNATVVALLLAYIAVRHLRQHWASTLAVVGALAFAVAMGLSRVYLGHHWLTDVIAGWGTGAAWAGLVVVADQMSLRVRDRRRQRVADPQVRTATG